MQVDTTRSAVTNTATTTSKKEDTSAKSKDQILAESTKEALGSKKLDKDTIEKLKNIGGEGITNFYIAQFMQQSLNSTFGNVNAQNSVFDFSSGFSGKAKAIQAFSQVDFAAIGYTGKNPLSMNQNELNELIGENGFFGMENTANRIADFVINGAGDDLEKLKKGFEGMKQGFEQAERMWGGKLPQISQDTIDKAIEKVSARIEELGGNAVNIKA